MQVMDEMGQVKPLISSKRLTQLMEDVLGFKLKSEGEAEMGEQGGTLAPDALNQLNPVGQTGAVQVPTATNLQQTVPQMPSGDSRMVNI